ncbi:MAG: hypothetical protein KDA79_11500 [Planctomycetaceae bacterium]|nr:hypothetical protein [Planctomycetaceae bacterium]
MLNRLTNVLTESQQSQPADSRWRVDRHPGRRLVWLFCVLMLPLLAVSGRLIWIQTVVRQRFIEPWETVRESIELIPSIDGRILSADGQVLAHDEVTFDVHINYRWLEEPADPAWLRRQAMARLEPADRRDKDLVEARQEELRELRRQLWADLPGLLNRNPEDLAAARSQIQQRVERIVASVEARRQADASPADPASETPSADRAEGRSSLWRNWQQIWNSARTELTTAPRRRRADPVVIREELDDHLLVRDIPLAVAARIESHPERWPGLRIQTSTRRIYPLGSAASHLVGIRRPVTEEELAKAGEANNAGHSAAAAPHAADEADADGSTTVSLLQPGDRIGRTGVEKTANERIRGQRGRRQIVRNRQGDLLETRLLAEARPGADVVLTVHLPLQQQLENLLDRTLAARGTGQPEEQAASLEEPDPEASLNEEPETGEPLPDSAGGSLIVMDVQTGAILAAASAPRIDLSQLQNPTPEYWQSLLNDPRRPFFHRAVAMSLPPGSVFKPVTSVALMESGQWDPDEPFECRGFLDRPDRHRCYIYRHFGVGHGPVTLVDALCQSCNVYYFAGARKIGAEPISGWASQFGFGAPTGIDLPGESGGNVPSPPMADPLGWQASGEPGRPGIRATHWVWQLVRAG